jgi:adenine-specific DNA-methyltransferase
MATGIPLAKGHAKQLGAKANGNSLQRVSIDITLSYEGKQSESSILATPPAILKRNDKEGVKGHSFNRLYFGENLSVLAALLNDPAVRGKVRLIYIDPPYATKSVFQSRQQADAYSDLLEGAHYIEFLRARLILLRELLADDGSIYVHLDDNMAFHAKAVMDEVFGASNFRNWITRKKCNPKNYTRKTFGNVSDYILFYTKSDEYVWNRPVEAWTELRADKEYQYTEAETGRRYKKVPVHAPGMRNGETGQPWRGKMPPPGKHWQYRPSTLDEMDARGEIYWSLTGNPRRKVYLDESEGVPVQDLWLDFRDAHNQNIQITGYPTEKNPLLLQQIIQASSNAGDLVLDCFAGSGTTLEGAHKLSRHWIGIDNSPEALRVILQRFASGLKPMGDFVAKSKDADNEMDLFGMTKDENAAANVSLSHEVIRDFEMWKVVPSRDNNFSD